MIAAGWLLGDRYGLPAGLAGLADRGFTAVENRLSGEAADAPASETDTASQQAGEVLPENTALRINEAGLDIIRDSEGLRLQAYRIGGQDYIGYGHQLQPGDAREITAAEADRLLRQDVTGAEATVRALLRQPAGENQFSAMVSLAYNLGGRSFSRSPVPALFNAGDVDGAADAFLGHNRGGGKVLPHLEERRQRERALFLTPDGASPGAA